MSGFVAVVLTGIGVVIVAGLVATSKKRTRDTMTATWMALQFAPLAVYVLCAYLLWAVAS